jgi:hypothetical protein
MANEQMVDVVVDAEAQAGVIAEPLYAGDDFNVFVDDAPQADEATQKLLDDLKAKQAELAAVQAQRDPAAAMTAGIAALGERLAPASAPDVRITAQQFDIKKLEEEFNAHVYDNPFQKTAELFQVFQSMSGAQQANANLQYSKRIVQVDPATRELYKRYEGEVEREVAAMTPQDRATNPNVYDDALGRVKARHMEELFQERLDAELKSRGAGVAPAARVAAPAQYSEGGGARVAVGAPPTANVGGRTLRITQAKKAEIEAFAADHMIPFNAALSLYERRGQLK